MLIDAIQTRLSKSGCLDSFWGKLDASEDATLGVASSARPLLIAARFVRNPQPTLVIVSGEEASLSFTRAIKAYLGDSSVLRFPEHNEVPGVGQAGASAEKKARVIAERYEALYALSSGRTCIVVASAQSLIRALPPQHASMHIPYILKPGTDLSAGELLHVDDLESFKSALEAYGYQNTSELEGPGSFAVRGGVLDIFPGNLSYPVRIDFFGDEVDEIRRIVPTTGQTISSLSELSLFAVTEFPQTQQTRKHIQTTLEKPSLTNAHLRALLEELQEGLRFDGSDALLPYVYPDLSTIGDYVSPQALCSLIEPRSLFDNMTHTLEDLDQRRAASTFSTHGLWVNPAQVSFGNCIRATYVSIMQTGAGVDEQLPVKRTDVAGPHERLFAKMRGWIEANYLCVFSAPKLRAREAFALDFVDNAIPINNASDTASDTDTPAFSRGIVNLVDVDIPVGLVIPEAKIALVSINDLRRMSSEGTERKSVDITDITFPYKPGDYVVHATYGIALFKDIVQKEIDGEIRDYLELHYAGEDKLFLPIEQFDKVTRYVGAEGSVPKVTRLDSADWSRAITKARKATKKLAFDLVDVYSRRISAKGHAFHVHTPWMKQMEDSFPYQETPDQIRAIKDVFYDMASQKPMDRLICGDVGFGKTEVAIRAAFAAAQEGKQVMVLCPTTILAQQHYTSFKERMEPFGMRVDVLSRFRTPAQQKGSLESFAAGDVNVLVGTHRLLSRDVNPHDLGLVIIDEEQRFGVGHKEQFKNLRESVDVLTLSATPIPRTMQMATSGVRDMSLILTPPDERLPVQVHVGEWDSDLVSAAIRYELERKGQVYYVSNRVRTIDDALDRVLQAAPEARVGVAHGQMSKEALENVMEEFAAGEIDVLVATTIIESGIDNPHTNTLIIEDSQRLGLAQMYQLKGRVGRSSTQAYAYFMFPEDTYLTEDAQSRLIALSDNQDLGSGMRIALKDLEIRGAGDILGAEQSGNMSAVGFDLFSQMLNQAVIQLRESTAANDSQTQRRLNLSDITVNIPGSAYFSHDYLPDIAERVLWYRRIASAYTLEEVDALQSELEEKMGAAPDEALSLFEKARLRAFAAKHGISSLSLTAGKINIENLELHREARIRLKRDGGRYLPDKSKVIIPFAKLSASPFVKERDASYQNESDDSARLVLRYLEYILEGDTHHDSGN